MRDDRVQHDWVLDWEAPPVANTRVGLYNEARLKGAYDELEEKPVVYSTPAELATQYQGKYEKLRATPRADVPRFWRQHVADGRPSERQATPAPAPVTRGGQRGAWFPTQVCGHPQHAQHG